MLSWLLFRYGVAVHSNVQLVQLFRYDACPAACACPLMSIHLHFNSRHHMTHLRSCDLLQSYDRFGVMNCGMCGCLNGHAPPPLAGDELAASLSESEAPTTASSSSTSLTSLTSSVALGSSTVDVLADVDTDMLERLCLVWRCAEGRAFLPVHAACTNFTHGHMQEP